MKKKEDPRHKAREQKVTALFELSFTGARANDSIAEIVKVQSAIDKQIIDNAPAWPIEQIAPIDLAVLRLAIWELIYKKEKEPYKVVVDEAVELAKEFGQESSPSFVNGVLGSIIKKINTK